MNASITGIFSRFIFSHYHLIAPKEGTFTLQNDSLLNFIVLTLLKIRNIYVEIIQFTYSIVIKHHTNLASKLPNLWDFKFRLSASQIPNLLNRVMVNQSPIVESQ